MGMILDSGAAIAGERKGQTLSELIGVLQAQFPDESLALTTVSVVELEHGIWRAKDGAQADRRRRFLEGLFAAIPIYPLTFEIARRAARVDGESRRNGVTIPFPDLIIGVTALEFGYSVLTTNSRHFRLIPDLRIHEV